MKSISLLILITVLILSGCSKTGQTTSAEEISGAAAAASAAGGESTTSGLFAYIPYRSGRIDSYIVRNGKFEKTGEVRVEWPKTPVADPSGKFLYAADNTGTITRFIVGGNGVLSSPLTFKPGLNNHNITCIRMDPKGKYVVVAGNAGDLDGRVTAVIILCPIAPDGTLGKPLDRLEINEAIGDVAVAPEGGGLVVSMRSGIKRVGLDAGGKFARTEVLNVPLGIVDNITFAPDASVATLSTYNEFVAVVLASMDQNKMVVMSSARMPDPIGGSLVESIAVDDHSNVLATNFIRWLCVFRIQNNQLVEARRYMIFKNHKVASYDEALQLLKAYPEYEESYEKFVNTPGADPRTRGEFGAAFYHASIIDTIRLAPDGDVYASCTSGVYRFKSSAQGLSYAGPAVTWNDTADKFTGKHQAPENEMMNAQPVDDGMIFVQRK